jgi:uncharacterized protein with NRDE domain
VLCYGALVCTLLAFRAAYALWIAANRNEKLDRPWKPPGLVMTEPPVVAGIDMIAGGSWLAVNLRGAFVVGVTNARLGAGVGVRSRGHLVLDLASQALLAEAVALLTELDLASYGPANLMIADADRVWLATNWPRPEVRESKEAVVCLRNDPLREPGRSTRWAAGLAEELADEGPPTTARLAALLARHDGPDPVCRHGDGYGTVCSTVLRIDRAGPVEMAFAAGKPCEVEHVGVALRS